MMHQSYFLSPPFTKLPQAGLPPLSGWNSSLGWTAPTHRAFTADWGIANRVLLGFAVRTHNENLSLCVVMSAQNSSIVACYLTPKEVAARLRVCRRTIERELVGKRFPPPLRVGRCLRFRVSDVEAFEKSGVWPPKASL